MTRTYNFFLLCFLLCFTSVLTAQVQTVVEGTVIDKKTKLPVEFANIRFKGAFQGTRTDSAGNFKIASNQKVSSLIVSFVGYKLKETPIEVGKKSKLTIELTPTNLSLNEIVIKPKKTRKREIDTTALYIYHKVVEHKDENKASNISSYHYNEYTKMAYSLLNPTRKITNAGIFKPYKFFFDRVDTSDKGQAFIPIFLQEDLRETWYKRKPQKKTNVVHYRHISGVKNAAFVKLIGYHFEVTDAYENVHVVFQKSFESPFAPGATVVYNYHVLDTDQIEGRTSYQLNFVAKVHQDLLLKGYAWIDSATWAIKYISYRPDERANMNYIYYLQEEQTFELVDTIHWIMTKEHQVVEGNLLKQQQKPALRIEKTTVRKDIETNVAIPDSITKNKDDIVDYNTYKRPVTYMDSMRLDTLSTAEKVVYTHWDSLQHVPAYIGLRLFATLVTTGNLKAGPIDFGRLYRVISRNNVEGWRVRMGFRTNADLSDKVYLAAYGAYGTHDKAWKYSFNARCHLPTKYNRWHAIELEYKSDMLILGQENSFTEYDDITTLISGYTLTKVMKTRELNLYYERDWIKGLSSNIEASQRTFFSVPGAFNFTRPDGTYLPSFNTTELSADLRYCKTDYYFEYYTYRAPLQTKTPSITFKYTLGAKNKLFGGDYTYHKLSLEFRYRWQLPDIGFSKIWMKGGYIFGDAPYPVSFISSSNISFIRDDLSMQSAAPFEFAMDKFFTVWWEHYFDGFFFNRIPYVNRLHLREFIQCKAVIGGFSSHNASLITVPSDIKAPYPVPYVEVGCGIENILNLFQVGFFWRCTYRNNPNAANFSVKLGIYPGF